MHEVLIPLDQLQPGQAGEVAQLMGQPDHVQRLEELGLRPGVAVEMVTTGSPCIIRLAGTKLCLREADMFNVLVRPGACA